MSEFPTTKERVRSYYTLGRRAWGGYHEAADELITFWEGVHLDESASEAQYQKNPLDLQITGQETFNVSRHKLGQLMAEPISVFAKPIDKDTDPEMAEVASDLLNDEMADTRKGFSIALEKAALGALVAKYGVAVMEFCPQLGEFGEIMHRNPISHSRLFWEPPYENPHDLRCGWIIEEVWVPLTWIQAQKDWSNTDRVVADNGRPVNTMYAGQLRSDPVAGGSGAMGEPGKLTEQSRNALLWVCYERNLPANEVAVKKGSGEELAPEKQFMRCANPTCAHRTPQQGQVSPDTLSEHGGQFPDSVPGGCPDCGGDMEKQTIAYATENVKPYGGKQYTVLAPNCSAEDGEGGGLVLYEGGWPVPRLRSFPVLVVRCNPHPTKAFGPSDVLLNWSAQVGKDLIDTVSLQRLLESRNYWLLPTDGLNDVNGERFEMRNDQFNIMIYDGDYSRDAVQVKTGAALDPSASLVSSMLRDTLLGKQGITDLGLTAESSKKVPVGTIEQMTQTGDIPYTAWKKHVLEQLAIYFGVWWDMVRETYPAQRVQKMLGTDVILQGDELPNMDFILSATQPFNAQDKERADAFQQYTGLAMKDPELADVLAEINRMPPSVTSKVKRILERRKMEAQAAAQNGPPGPGGGPQGGPPMPPPFADRMGPPAAEMVGAALNGGNGGPPMPPR